MEEEEKPKSGFDHLKDEVQRGIEGKNNGIPIGFNRINRYIGIRKRIMTLIFGPTGSGKTSLMHDMYILNPFDYFLKNRDIKRNYKFILFSMERSKVYVLAKWISRKIFIEEGIYIPIQKLLGWWTDNRLTKDEHDLFLHYQWYIDEILEMVDFVEGPQNPTGIYKYVKNFAEKHGRVEEISEFKKVYIPNDPDLIVGIGEDHLGLTKLEKGLNTKKEAIDKVSEYNQVFRDFYGFTPVPVSQLTRNLNNPIYQKMDSFEPTIDDIKESGRPGEDSDVVISIFEPLRYRTNDPSYKAENFVDQSTGAKYFRSVKILKNSYGEDDVRAGLAFMGSTSILKELPKAREMEGFDFQQIFNGQYFLNN